MESYSFWWARLCGVKEIRDFELPTWLPVSCKFKAMNIPRFKRVNILWVVTLSFYYIDVVASVCTVICRDVYFLWLFFNLCWVKVEGFSSVGEDGLKVDQHQLSAIAWAGFKVCNHFFLQCVSWFNPVLWIQILCIWIWILKCTPIWIWIWTSSPLYGTSLHYQCCKKCEIF